MKLMPIMFAEFVSYVVSYLSVLIVYGFLEAERFVAFSVSDSGKGCR